MDSDDTGSGMVSIVSGNFGQERQLKTPGFNVSKQFTFTGVDPTEDTVQVLSDGSDDYSVSSMNSETFKFGNNGFSRSRTTSGKRDRRINNRVSGAMSVVSLPDESYSDSSSELNLVRDEPPGVQLRTICIDAEV